MATKRPNPHQAFLEEFTADDLRFLCGMYKLSSGGSKTELARRLLSSDYGEAEILGTARIVRFSNDILRKLSKAELGELLQRNGITRTGPKEYLIGELIRNHMVNPAEILRSFPRPDLRDVYYDRMGRVATRSVSDSETMEAILGAYGLGAGTSVVDPSQTIDQPARHFAYDVALSFAGENREIANSIYEALTSRKVRVFFDTVEKAELWGKNLPEAFRNRYGALSRFVVPLVSRDYLRKDWPNYELSVAKEEAGRRDMEFVLPVQLDDTVHPGLPRTIGYLDWRKEGHEGVVKTLPEKLRGVGQWP